MQLELSGDTVKFHTSEREENELKNFANAVSSLAIDFTEQCMLLLVKNHNAKLDGIAPMIFYERYIGLCIINAGKDVLNPKDFVEHAIKTYRPEFLGLVYAGVWGKRVEESKKEYAEKKMTTNQRKGNDE